MSGAGKTVADIIQERRGKKTTECFQIVDGRSRPQMLTVERISEASVLLSYHNFNTAKINADQSKIDAEFRDKLLVIQGHELAPIFAGLSDHRVTYVRELPPEAFISQTPAIRKILIMGEDT